jgi:hypothetical protein
MFTKNLPKHLYTNVDTAFTHEKPQGFMPAIWFAITSTPGRAWGCHVLLENGAIYRNLPLHALHFNPEAFLDLWHLHQAQRWNCYGWKFTTIEYTYLQGLRCLADCDGEKYSGKYLFTAAPFDDAFSDDPEQNKEFLFIQLDNGRVTAQPTNKVMMFDDSFHKNTEWPAGLKVSKRIYSCE